MLGNGISGARGITSCWGEGVTAPKTEDMTYSRYHRKKGDELEEMRWRRKIGPRQEQSKSQEQGRHGDCQI